MKGYRNRAVRLFAWLCFLVVTSCYKAPQVRGSSIGRGVAVDPIEYRRALAWQALAPSSGADDELVQLQRDLAIKRKDHPAAALFHQRLACRLTNGSCDEPAGDLIEAMRRIGWHPDLTAVKNCPPSLSLPATPGTPVEVTVEGTCKNTELSRDVKGTAGRDKFVDAHVSEVSVSFTGTMRLQWGKVPPPTALISCDDAASKEATGCVVDIDLSWKHDVLECKAVAGDPALVSQKAATDAATKERDRAAGDFALALRHRLDGLERLVRQARARELIAEAEATVDEGSKEDLFVQAAIVGREVSPRIAARLGVDALVIERALEHELGHHVTIDAHDPAQNPRTVRVLETLPPVGPAHENTASPYVTSAVAEARAREGYDLYYSARSGLSETDSVFTGVGLRGRRDFAAPAKPGEKKSLRMSLELEGRAESSVLGGNGKGAFARLRVLFGTGDVLFFALGTFYAQETSAHGPDPGLAMWSLPTYDFIVAPFTFLRLDIGLAPNLLAFFGAEEELHPHMVTTSVSWMPCSRFYLGGGVNWYVVPSGRSDPLRELERIHVLRVRGSGELGVRF